LCLGALLLFYVWSLGVAGLVLLRLILGHLLRFDYRLVIWLRLLSR
jgi:hypothetical protein